tara:strand:+ start:4205 stop:4456 length:252 start_codon:yes stop_codon:yes gene_type:complete
LPANYKYLKSQLIAVALRLLHQDLVEVAQNASLRGKGEAVGFASFVTKGLIQSAEHNMEAVKLVASYSRCPMNVTVICILEIA